MIDGLIGMVIGLFLGVLIGAFLVAILTISKRSDEHGGEANVRKDDHRQ